jgi:hypothetical protein
MRIWRYQGVHRLAWVILALLVLAVAVFAMAAGFSRLRGGAVPAGSSADALEARVLQAQCASISTCPPGLHEPMPSECESPLLSA